MTECQCKYCQSSCRSVPGWFMPGEAEKVAEYLETTLPDFFKKYLGVNWWCGEEDIFLLAPATTRITPGTEYPANPKGQCIFFKDVLCQIHPVKPFECAQSSHDDSSKVVDTRHYDIALAWQDYHQQIVDLLDREPVSEDFTTFDYLSTFHRY